VVRRLVAKGARVDLRNAAHESAVDLACEGPKAKKTNKAEILAELERVSRKKPSHRQNS
jgi:hypothetical protein